MIETLGLALCVGLGVFVLLRVVIPFVYASFMVASALFWSNEEE